MNSPHSLTHLTLTSLTSHSPHSHLPTLTTPHTLQSFGISQQDLYTSFIDSMLGVNSDYQTLKMYTAPKPKAKRVRGVINVEMIVPGYCVIERRIIRPHRMHTTSSPFMSVSPLFDHTRTVQGDLVTLYCVRSFASLFVSPSPLRFTVFSSSSPYTYCSGRMELEVTWTQSDTDRSPHR